MAASKEDFREHLTRLGFVFGASREEVKEMLRRQMGDERYAEFQRLSAGAKDGDSHARIYEFFRDATEANLLRSVDQDVALETSYYLYERSRPLMGPGKCVVDLGCWTGGLASFIAAHHPANTVFGVDRVRHIVELNRRQHAHPNLTFQCWDYRLEKPPALPPADVLLCGLGVLKVPDGGFAAAGPHAIRNAPGYRQQREDAFNYFRNWRSIAKEGARLFAVLRVGTFGRFLAYVDAAQAAGWTPQLDQWERVPVEAARESLPALSFVARRSPPVSQEAALAQFVRMTTLGNPYLRLVGGLALALYSQMGARDPLHRQTYVNEGGWLTHEEIGTCGAFGYFFSHTDLPDYWLSILSVTAARREAQRFQQAEEGRLGYAASAPEQGVYVLPPAPVNFAGTFSDAAVAASLGGGASRVDGEPEGAAEHE